MRGGVTDAGRTNNKQRTLKIELLSQWKLEAEFRNMALCPQNDTNSISDVVHQSFGELFDPLSNKVGHSN